MNDGTALLLQIAAGVGLAACAGLRAFLPLLLTGAAARLEWIELGERFTWLASWPALTVFAVAVVVEFLADKIPVVDHALDVLETILKPAAGAILVMALVSDLDPLPTAVLGILAGGGTAGVLHVAKAKLRLWSTALTMGFANPLISIAEDGLSLFGTLLALLVPLLMLVALVGAAMLVAGILLLRRTASAGA